MSMVHEKMLDWIHQRIKQIFGNQLDFGGISIIAVGDFCQLQCVGGTPLYKGKSHLFNKFEVMHFTQQMRAARDLDHTNMIETFRDVNSSGFTDEMFKKLKVLNISDFTGPESFHWKFDVPVLVTTNQTKDAIDYLKIKYLAKEIGVPLVRWKIPTRPEIDESVLNSSDLFWNYFVVGAPVMLTENLSPPRGLANGTAGKMHSLTFHTQEL